MSGADLLPCPFCGAEPPDVHLSHITGRIFCEGCGAEGPWSPAFDGDWNTRAHPAQEPPSPGVTAGATGAENRPPFEFHRYINGQLMAEGVRIEKQATLEGAMVAAAKIASRGPNGEAPVLVLATPAPVVPAEGLERALLAHHKWHQRLGVIVFPPEDDQDEPTAIDMSVEYADSRLHEQTVAALSGASIVQSVDDHAHAALSHTLQYLRGEAPNVTSGGHRNGQLRSMIKWVLLGCGGPLRTAPPVGARVTGWQQIETAPHEELVVLGWQEDGAWKQEIALASAGERFPNGYSNMWTHGRATHWMPLPEPPAALLPAGEGE